MLEKPGKPVRWGTIWKSISNTSSRFNTILTNARRENNKGHYDIHTNTFQWPRTMQPTHARWERLERERADADGEGDGDGDGQKKLANGISGAEHDVDEELSSIFKKLDPIYPRNFMINDLSLEGAPESKFGPPGRDNNPQSLSDLPRDVLDELPADCRQAFEESKKREVSWRAQWDTESTDGKRARFMSTVEWFP